MTSAVRYLVLCAPILLVGLFSVVLAIPTSRALGVWLLLENHPVEVATFCILVAAGLGSLFLAWGQRRRAGARLTQLFYLAFGAGLILTGMEEIAWGQYWLGFETPAVLAELNVKGEATLHNIGGIDGRTEAFRVLFGVGGLVGVWLNRTGRLPDITPPTVLWTWFATITILASYDFANDITPLVGELDSLIDRIDELVELLIGLAALLFISIKIRELAGVTRLRLSDPSGVHVGRAGPQDEA